MTAADRYRQASIFEWTPMAKPWEVPPDALLRSPVEQYVKDFGKIPDPDDYDLAIRAEYSSFATQEEQRFIRISGVGIHPLHTFIEIATGEVTNRIAVGHARASYTVVDSIAIEGDECIVSTEGELVRFKLVETDMSVDWAGDNYRRDGCLKNFTECDQAAVWALSRGYPASRVEAMTYGCVSSLIYDPVSTNENPMAADLLMELAERHGLPTWLSQDVPDLFESGLTKDRMSSCESCRHRNLCHPNTTKTETELRGQGCSDYGRNLKLKGRMKALKFDDDGECCS